MKLIEPLSKKDKNIMQANLSKLNKKVKKERPKLKEYQKRRIKNES